MKLKKRVLAGQCMEVGKEFDLTKVEDDQAFDKAISMLDTAFQYDIRFRMPQDFDAHFNLSRRPGTSLFSFVTANLTKEQNQLVFTQAPKLEKLRVQEALFVILGQEYKSAVSHDQRLFANNRFQPGKAFAAHDYETYDDSDAYEDGYYEYDEYYETEAYDESWADDRFDADAAYFQEDETALEFDQHPEPFDV